MKRLARFTPQEEKAWEHYFREGKGMKYGDLRADAYAWRQMRAEFPRLRKYDGARP